MPGTELERDTWTILALIAERARREPQCQFTSLAHLLDERFLAACYRRLGRDRASGVDGVTWRENAQRQKRRANTFDFLGFTHYCGASRRGKFIVGRQTSRKKFRKKCQELREWLKAVRNLLPVKEWWPTLKAKLLGHYQYYGVSGNMRGIARYYRRALRLAWKWLNRRSQCKSFSWAGFLTYLAHYPLPKPRIVHNLYTLSPVT